MSVRASDFGVHIFLEAKNNEAEGREIFNISASLFYYLFYYYTINNANNNIYFLIIVQ